MVKQTSNKKTTSASTKAPKTTEGEYMQTESPTESRKKVRTKSDTGTSENGNLQLKALEQFRSLVMVSAPDFDSFLQTENKYLEAISLTESDAPKDLVDGIKGLLPFLTGPELTGCDSTGKQKTRLAIEKALDLLYQKFDELEQAYSVLAPYKEEVQELIHQEELRKKEEERKQLEEERQRELDRIAAEEAEAKAAAEKKKKIAENKKTYKVRSSVTFGSYRNKEEIKVTKNWLGQEKRKKTGNFEQNPIEWKVAANDGEEVILVCKEGLDVQPFHQEEKAVKWEESDLCKWLNTSFRKEAFTAKEREMIPADGISLLTAEEAALYINGNLKLSATPYAKSRGANVLSNGNSWWWLKSDVNNKKRAAAVTGSGTVSAAGALANQPDVLVRPVIRLRLL